MDPEVSPARRYAPLPGEDRHAWSAGPPPLVPMVRESAVPALVPAGIVTAGLGLGGGLVLSLISVSEDDGALCNSRGCADRGP